MKSVNVVLVSVDECYANNLIDCIKNKKVAINISWITNLEKISKCDVIILDNFNKNQLDKNIVKTTPVIKIVEKRNKFEQKSFYKYDTLTKLIDLIYEIHGKHNGIEVLDVKYRNIKTKLYNFISNVGGCGVSSIAIGFANECSIAFGDTVLYISMKPFHEEMRFFGYDMHADNLERRTLREYLYNYLYEDKMISNEIASFLLQNDIGVYAFYTDGIINEWMKLDEKQFVEVLQGLIKQDYFDKIIVDMGNNYSRKFDYLLEMSERNILVDNLTCTTFDKLKMQELNLDEQKSIFVRNFTKSSEDKFYAFFESSEDENDTNSHGLLVPYDNESFLLDDGVVRIDVAGKFANAIRKIVDSINKN